MILNMSTGARYLCALFAIVTIVIISMPVSRASGYFRDFNAFYCAGAAIASGRDPYVAEPIGACERRPRPAWVESGAVNLSLPAPLPPYALAPFVVLSRLPLVAAAWIWSMLLLAAFGVTVWSLRRATGLGVPSLVGIFAIDCYSAIFLGEIAALAVAVIALASMLLEMGKTRQAACAAALALIEPHVGLPAVLALFVTSPAARVPLACISAAFGVVSVLLVGSGTTIEYLGAVLPSHALSELGSERQLSLSSLAHLAGASDRIALNVGFLNYYVMILVGVIVAMHLKRFRPHDGLIVAAPVAFALLGGVFMHVAQMQAALPSALLGFVATNGRLRRLFGASIVLLAVPWVQFTFLGLIFVPLAALTVAFLARVPLKCSALVSTIAGCTAMLFVVALISGILIDPQPPSFSLPNVVPTDLAEVNWALHVAAQGGRNRVTFLLARLPTWFGVAMLCFALLRLAILRRFSAAGERLAGTFPRIGRSGRPRDPTEMTGSDAARRVPGRSSSHSGMKGRHEERARFPYATPRDEGATA